MFAREGGYRDLVSCPVHLKLSDGTLVKGHIERPRSKSLGDVMNDKDRFIEVERFDGTRELINKQSVQSCASKDVPTGEHLKLAVLKADLYNPLAVLGLDASADKAMIRDAYMKLAKQYHPDRFHSADLPGEVIDYIETMARRINLAYEEALEMVEPAAKAGAASGHE